MPSSSILALLILSISCSFTWFFYLIVLSCSYVMRELVAKNAFASSSLPSYPSDKVNVFSIICVFTTTQISKFFESHLRVAEWYLDCSGGFVPEEEKSFLASRVSIAPEDNIVTFEEPDIVELPHPPPKAPKGKGRTEKTAPQASSQVVTWSFFKDPRRATYLSTESICRPLSYVLDLWSTFDCYSLSQWHFSSLLALEEEGGSLVHECHIFGGA